MKLLSTLAFMAATAVTIIASPLSTSSGNSPAIAPRDGQCSAHIRWSQKWHGDATPFGGMIEDWVAIEFFKDPAGNVIPDLLKFPWESRHISPDGGWLLNIRGKDFLVGVVNENPKRNPTIGADTFLLKYNKDLSCTTWRRDESGEKKPSCSNFNVKIGGWSKSGYDRVSESLR